MMLQDTDGSQSLPLPQQTPAGGSGTGACVDRPPMSSIWEEMISWGFSMPALLPLAKFAPGDCACTES